MTAGLHNSAQQEDGDCLEVRAAFSPAVDRYESTTLSTMNLTLSLPARGVLTIPQHFKQQPLSGQNSTAQVASNASRAPWGRIGAAVGMQTLGVERLR